MADTHNLRLFESQKRVHAARILRVKHNAAGSVELLELRGADGDILLMTTFPAQMFARYVPVAGDYYVVYEDGYASISPRQAFEQGYIELLNISDAAGVDRVRGMVGVDVRGRGDGMLAIYRPFPWTD